MAFKFFGNIADDEPAGHLVSFDEMVDGSTHWSCVCGFKSADQDEVLKHAEAWLIKHVPMVSR